MTKTEVIYDGERYNPNREEVTHVAIQSETNPPYVWRTYKTSNETNLPKLGKDLVLMPIRAARNLFDFKEGKLVEVARS